MNRRGRPAKAAPQRPGDRVAGNSSAWGSRNWRREINQLPDRELISVVRAMVAVDHAVNTYRKQDAKTVFLPPSPTRTP